MKTQANIAVSFAPVRLFVAPVNNAARRLAQAQAVADVSRAVTAWYYTRD